MPIKYNRIYKKFQFTLDLLVFKVYSTHLLLYNIKKYNTSKSNKKSSHMFEDLFTQNNSVKINPNNRQLHQLPKIKTAILPECLNNLSYPSCDKQNHQTQPLSMVCIDQSCTDRTLICSLCQSSKHYQHLCIPLKIYLNEVFGHNYQSQPQYVSQQLPILFEEQPSSTKKIKNKNNKNKNKNKQQQSKPIVKKNIENSNSYKNHNQNNILYYLTKIQQQKKELLKNLNINRENILDKFHTLQTDITNYYNKMLQQVSMLVKMQNPVSNIQKLVNNIKAYHDKRYHQNSTEKQQQSNHILQKHQTNKLKQYISTILRSTSLQQKYNPTQKMQIIFSQVSKVTQQIQKTLSNSHDKYIQQIDKLKQLINKQSNIVINNVILKKSFDFKFSQKYKGHKFVLKNQNKIAQQTGMQSSGQRFILMQPSLSKVNKFQMKKTNIWGIKIGKIAGWVGIGISLKNILIKANYHFNYTNIGHGSYLISNNGYSWSHSNKDFNSAYKSFSFAAGDIVYIEYNPMQKKLKFYKNLQTNTFQLDVVEPPENQEYCPSINMCSNGDSVEVINEKPGFL